METCIPVAYVLDHGFIKYRHHMGDDLAIIHNARQSYDAPWSAGMDTKSDRNLMKYLMANGHNTPFEVNALTIQVKAPIFVFRQWHRHRTQSYNELSARYRKLDAEFYVPVLSQITTQSTDNKQMRTDEQNPHAVLIQNYILNQNTEAFAMYEILLGRGCPRELARSVLPVGTYSTMSATANLHNWMGFLKERLHPHAQYEIRVYAIEVFKILEELYPECMRTFTEVHNL
jgi:thymidylate synthase (FAD)